MTIALCVSVSTRIKQRSYRWYKISDAFIVNVLQSPEEPQECSEIPEKLWNTSIRGFTSFQNGSIPQFSFSQLSHSLFNPTLIKSELLDMDRDVQVHFQSHHLNCRHHANNNGQQSFPASYLILLAIPSIPFRPLSSDIEATSQTDTAGLTYSGLFYS